jgi:DNA-binding transcriptional regulator YhcF (GntR family)
MRNELPVLRIDLGSVVPVYEQLASGIRIELVSGRLEAGHQLPTVRELGLDLGIHHNTVAEAYRVLAREGWLDLRRGRGAVVVERPRPVPRKQAQADFSQQLRALAARAVSEGVPGPVVAAELSALGLELAEPHKRPGRQR